MELLVLSPTKTSYLKELQFQPLPGVEFKPVSQESPGQWGNLPETPFLFKGR